MNFKAYYAGRQSICTDLHVTKFLQIAISKNIKGLEAVSICESGRFLIKLSSHALS